MTPVNQRTRDDCFRACVASILNLSYEEVPDFMADVDTGAVIPDSVTDWMNTWFHEREMCYAEMGFPASPWKVMQDTRHMASENITYLLMGRGLNSVNHCVVCRSGEMIHDPGAHLGSHGVTQPASDGYTRIGLILVNKSDFGNSFQESEHG